MAERSVTEQDGLPIPQRYWAAATIATALTMAGLDGAIANVALPTIARDLHASAASSIWVVNAYQLVTVVCLAPLASLGDIIGYRRIYWMGLAVFTLASLVCATSSSLLMLALARALQGFGAAGIMSVNAGLVRYTYPQKLLGRGIGINTLVIATSTAAGPTIASGVLAVAHWQWLFLINVPIGIVALVLAMRSLPYTEPTGQHFDLPSAVLSALTFGLLITGIDSFGHALGLPLVLAEIAAAVGLGIVLVRRQESLIVPILPVDLFRRPVFALSALTSMCSFTAQGIAFVALPFYFQDILGRSQVETGLLLTPWPLAVAVAAPFAGRLAEPAAGRHVGRFRARDPRGRTGPCRAASGASRDGGYRLAHDHLRARIRVLPIAEQPRDHHERAAVPDRQRRRGSQHCPPARPDHRGGAGRSDLWRGLPDGPPGTWLDHRDRGRSVLRGGGVRGEQPPADELGDQDPRGGAATERVSASTATP